MPQVVFGHYDVTMTSLWRNMVCLGQLREALEDTRYECYPIGEFLAGLGFFIVIGFELVIITYQNKHKIPSRVWFYAKWREIYRFNDRLEIQNVLFHHCTWSITESLWWRSKPRKADSFDEIDSEDHEQTIASLTASYQSNGAPMFFENSINSGLAQSVWVTFGFGSLNLLG